MKFKVKVGKIFEVEAVTVEEQGSKDSLSVTKAMPLLMGQVLACCIAAAVLYGAFTGDFSPLEGLANAGKDLISVMARSAGAVMER